MGDMKWKAQSENGPRTSGYLRALRLSAMVHPHIEAFQTLLVLPLAGWPSGSI
jgi:hypothetical protein